MEDHVKLSRVRERFEDLDYPVTRADAAVAFDDVTLTFADGDRNLGLVISEVGADTFESPDDMFEEVQSHLPMEALGEPGQSDGDA